MNRFDRAQEGRAAVRQAEAECRIADSMEVRKALMQQVTDGEITLEEAQAELKRIKRNAKRNGKATRNQVFTGRA